MGQLGRPGEHRRIESESERPRCRAGAAVLASRGFDSRPSSDATTLTQLLNKECRRVPVTEWSAIERLQQKRCSTSTRKSFKRATTVITIDWRDPGHRCPLGQRLLWGLANDLLLRSRAMQESTRNIEYLNKALADTDVVEIQRMSCTN